MIEDEYFSLGHLQEMKGKSIDYVIQKASNSKPGFH